MEKLDELDITVMGSTNKCWEYSLLFRGDQILGSLEWVRSAFHVWKRLKDGEGMED